MTILEEMQKPATAGLTYEKLLEIKQNFMANDVATNRHRRIKMDTIIKLANLCTSINIQPKYKIDHEDAPVACEINAHVRVKSKDGHMQYADINVGASSVSEAIERAYRIALAYHTEATL